MPSTLTFPQGMSRPPFLLMSSTASSAPSFWVLATTANVPVRGSRIPTLILLGLSVLLPPQLAATAGIVPATPSAATVQPAFAMKSLRVRLVFVDASACACSSCCPMNDSPSVGKSPGSPDMVGLRLPFSLHSLALQLLPGPTGTLLTTLY